jgi:NitT/TauT family transport system ATP-binding protein
MLASEGGRADLALLASDLVLELDDLLPIVEAGELLGLLALSEGEITSTPLGQAYAEASILARKELIAARVLRLPEIGWMYEALQHDDDQRIHRSFFLDRLGASLGDFATQQLDVAIRWGRYAELFAYDADREELFLEH